MILLVLGWALAWSASWRAEISLDQLAAASRGVVRGEVVSVQVEQGPRGLQSSYRIQVDEAWGIDDDEVVVRMPGGRAGGRVQHYAGVPVWREGAQVVVFLPPVGRLATRGALTVGADQALGDVGSGLVANFPRSLDVLVQRLDAISASLPSSND